MKITAEEFDKKFDNNEDISQYLDFENATTLGEFDKQFHQTKKINIDFPIETVMLLDQKAKQIGITRQSIVKVWIAERLKAESNQLPR
ncbi:Helix-turn-helix protein, CopG family [uncultured Candidatus Thioglobus sp.]|nr:Helix-turn-helix protein, CopG family [uncultured Candidatus Thioglobus sp.]SMN02187.1 Helix-turn-helix protein, CopG family [uncultured Candidatus Thioglobus sp.]